MGNCRIMNPAKLDRELVITATPAWVGGQRVNGSATCEVQLIKQKKKCPFIQKYELTVSL